ncbi:MAG: class II fructose-bisphosphate aldolase [Spirochaetales bacterium]|jgi:fructose-bisphosphate aldolase, class II|nr:class II fructose-bisphosphate aldolase [Spirochaetales bacterium]
MSTSEIMINAWKSGIAIPAFNVPYLPMLEPIVRAATEEDSFVLIEVARLEWTKFRAESPETVAVEFQKQMTQHVRLHLDHIPVIDEDSERVDYLEIIKRALDCGYQSVMIDGSRLSLDENIRCAAEAADLAHRAGVPCEAELGAVMGHESGPLPSYEDIFTSGKGFTDPGEAARLISETECDWLSVAVGSIHGAVSGALKDKKKVAARLDINHLKKLNDVCAVPLVLHGGSGVIKDYVMEGIENGIAKVNVGTEIRQTYEQSIAADKDVAEAQQAVFDHVSELIREYFGISGKYGMVTKEI